MEHLESPLTAPEVDLFRSRIYEYYSAHGRDLPWRRTIDPYRILVSEVMLQQTQVERVAGKYEEFLYVFPTVRALADASLKDVLALWQGLGYNRRALALSQAAGLLATRHEGRLPETIEALSALPGVGKATASAILAFAFGKPVAFIETNIRRTFIDYFFEGREGVKDRDILSLVEETLDRKDPRNWYYALMDYGSMLGKGRENPNRRSSRYRKQTPFKDSDRKIRGAVVRLLIGNRGLSIPTLEEETGADRQKVRSILSAMEREGLIREEEGVYVIP